jgi:hypothetical protein
MQSSQVPGKFSRPEKTHPSALKAGRFAPILQEKNASTVLPPYRMVTLPGLATTDARY